MQEVAASRRAHGTVLVAGNARQLQRYALKTTLRRDSCSYHSRLLASFHSVSDARGQPATGGYHARYRAQHLHINDLLVLHFQHLKSVPFGVSLADRRETPCRAHHRTPSAGYSSTTGTRTIRSSDTVSHFSWHPFLRCPTSAAGTLVEQLPCLPTSIATSIVPDGPQRHANPYSNSAKQLSRVAPHRRITNHIPCT